MTPLLAHVAGLPVEEAVPALAPVAGVWAFFAGRWIQYTVKRMQSRRGGR